MNISNFDEFLQAARHQALPQRLLFVFSAAEQADEMTAQQLNDFCDAQGGALIPKMCVDKTPDELRSFAELCAQADAMGEPWVILFAAAMEGLPGMPVASSEAQARLDAMVESIKAGDIHAFIPFNKQGDAVQLMAV